MVKIKSSHDQIINTIDWYEKNHIKYEYEAQNDTISLESKMGSYTTANYEYSIEELNFIKGVKHAIKSNGIYELYSHRYQTEASKKRIKYYLHGKKIKPGTVFTNCFNIDLNSAYWETAYKYDLLSEKTYQEGFEYRKQVRLTAIGSLAKKSRRYKFDGYRQKKLPVKRSKETEMLWSLICDHVGKLLCSVAKECGNDFLFFWVDGIYVRPGAEKKVTQLFKKAGYNSAIALCEKIETTDRHIWITCTEKPKTKIVDGKEILIDTRPFPFRKEEIQKELAGYMTDL